MSDATHHGAEGPPMGIEPPCICGHLRVWHCEGPPTGHSPACEITGPTAADGCDCKRYQPQQDRA